MSTTTDFFSKCLPAIRTNVATSGLMTVCDANVPVPGDLDTIFKNGSSYRIMEAMFMWQLELNACQAEQTPLFKYLMANKVNLNHKLSSEMINSGLMRIRPFILAKRKGPINNNYWIAASGAKALAPASATVAGVADPAGTYWNLTMSSPTSIPAHIGWFNVGDRLFVKGLADDGTSIDWAGVIAGRVVSGSNVIVTLSPQVAGSFLPSARVANPTAGLAVRGTPNVSDYESFCAQPPGLITGTEDPFFIETTRTTFREDELYNQWRDLVFANNPLYANLYDLPTIEYNKQVSEDFARRNVETFLRNKPLNANQTISGFNSLPDISTIGGSIGGVRCVGKRANATGIYEQHVECERVVDAQGAKLNIPALAQAIYKMQRVREASGSKATQVFEIAMPSTYAVLFNAAMLNYYKAQSQGMLQMFQDITREVKTAPLGFRYRDYPLMWPDGVTIRVVTDRYFDDYAAAMHAVAVAQNNVNYDNLGRQLWIMDWSRIYMGVFGSERRVNTPGKDLLAQQNLGIIDPCVIRTVSETNTLTSWTYTNIAECVAGNLIIENLSNEVPEHDVIGSVDYDENS